MKNLLPLSLLYLFSMFFACNTANQINTKEQLLNKLSIFLNQQELQKFNGKIVILTTEFCESFECVDYFSSLKKEIEFYSKEEAFMRGFQNYLIIDNVDTEKGIMKMRIRIKDNYKSIEMK